jgi:hypothetical protein
MIILGCPMITLGFSCSGGRGCVFRETGGWGAWCARGRFQLLSARPCAPGEDERALMIVLDAALPPLWWGEVGRPIHSLYAGRPASKMQDRTSANSMKVLLQRTAGPYIGVKSGGAGRGEPVDHVRTAPKADANSSRCVGPGMVCVNRRSAVSTESTESTLFLIGRG